MTIPKQLEELASLHERGILSKEEFMAAKEAILRGSSENPTISSSQKRGNGRPYAFKIMVILGYIVHGINVVTCLPLSYLEMSDGAFFSAITTLLSFPISILAISAIYFMEIRKSKLALKLIRYYLWAYIPLGVILSIITGIETDPFWGLFLLVMEIMIGVPTAIYWSRKVHDTYLDKFS